MVSPRMEALGNHRSVIRDLFEYGRERKAQIGEERVFDFSIGNPSAPVPAAVEETMCRLLRETDPVRLHGYTSAAGDESVRRTLAESITRRFGTPADAGNIYMTCGAAASLTIALTALVGVGDEVLVPAPFFPEYRVFVERTGAVLKELPCTRPEFYPDITILAQAITPHTRVLLLNSPNNPTGAVYPAEILQAIAAILTEKQREYGEPIYLIADEPYRELAYEVAVPYMPELYNNTLVCYSYSKVLSLPGERIGYIFVSPRAQDARRVYAAVCGAGRALGFICAPSLLQYTVAQCGNLTADLSLYRRNRDLMMEALSGMGYEVTPPNGAFYLFVKALEPDAAAFCERAKAHELLLVPSDDFGCPGYVRIAYCVTEEQIRRSLPAFCALYDDYRGTAR